MGWDELPQEKMTSEWCCMAEWKAHFWGQKKKRSEVTKTNFSSKGQGRVYSEDGSCGVAGRLWFWGGMDVRKRLGKEQGYDKSRHNMTVRDKCQSSPKQN